MSIQIWTHSGLAAFHISKLENTACTEFSREAKKENATKVPSEKEAAPSAREQSYQVSPPKVIRDYVEWKRWQALYPVPTPGAF